MILYNVTIGIDTDVEDEWKIWMLTTHIPDVMATGMFKKFEMFKILTDEDQGSSYSIQYTAESMNEVERYLGEFAPELIKRHLERYRDKHVAFRTLLEKVEL
jgi:hypothetical protein